MPIYRKCAHCGGKKLQGTLCKCEVEYKKQHNKLYDKQIRHNELNKKYTSFYKSIAWKKMSEHVRIKYNGLCLECLIKYKTIITSDVVHHIDEIKEAWDKRLNEDNLIPLCHICHNSIHADYTTDEKKMLKETLEEYNKKYIPGGP